MAAEHRLDISRVKGTGLNGRITKRDVLAALEKKDQSNQPGPAALLEPASPPLPGSLLPLNSVRKRIAEHMMMSKRTSPHVTTLMEADMSRVAAHRQAHKASFEVQGVRLTFTVYFVSATITALKAYPLVNSSWTNEGLLMHSQINIGMAADHFLAKVVEGLEGW